MSILCFQELYFLIILTVLVLIERLSWMQEDGVDPWSVLPKLSK